MNKKIISLAILHVLIIGIILSASVNAQDYVIGIDDNDEFIWEIKQLDVDKFKATFGTDPNFQVGSQVRMVIREVTDIEGRRWSIVTEFWDYGTVWSESGSIESLSIYKLPSRYDDYIFIPSPVQDYVEAAIEALPSQYYSLTDNMIGKQDISDLGVDFKVEKTFNIDGVMVSETYLDEANFVIVKLEATFQVIPFGFSFIGFMVLATIGMIIFIKMKKKTLGFKI